MTIDEYLEKVAKFAGNDYGRMVRRQFADIEGSAELAMLASPTAEELVQLRRAVAIMTESEKQNACNLSDEKVQSIASDAKIDPANLAIFINGYCIESKRVRE